MYSLLPTYKESFPLCSLLYKNTFLNLSLFYIKKTLVSSIHLHNSILSLPPSFYRKRLSPSHIQTFLPSILSFVFEYPKVSFPPKHKHSLSLSSVLQKFLPSYIRTFPPSVFSHRNISSLCHQCYRSSLPPTYEHSLPLSSNIQELPPSLSSVIQKLPPCLQP